MAAAVAATSPWPEAPVLAAGGVTLRPLLPSDAPAIAHHANDAQVVHNLFDGFPHPYTLAHAEAWCGPQHREPQWGIVWAIDRDGAAIGCLGLTPQAGMRACHAEIGYWIGHAHWGRGLVAPALRAATAWAWGALPQLTRIHAPIFARNLASQRVAEKAGYRLEARLPSAMLKAGQAIDITQYAAYPPGPGPAAVPH